MGLLSPFLKKKCFGGVLGAGMVPRRAGLSPGVRARTRPQFPRRDTVPRRCGVGQTRKRVCVTACRACHMPLGLFTVSLGESSVYF